MIYDLIILGGGPAGAAAAVYAARKQLKTLLITQEFGGQSVVSPEIYNWIGTGAVSGASLAKMLRDHVMEYAGDEKSLTIHEGAWVTSVVKNGEQFEVGTEKETFKAKSVLITTGSSRKKLSIPGAEKFENKGVVYCASCDGPLFSGQDVAVIGGGNAGFETVAQLSAYCKSVTLLHHRDTFKADPITVEKVRTLPGVSIITNAETIEVLGETFVNKIRYKDTKSGEEKTLPVTGIFVEIGQLPNTNFIGDLVKKTEYGNIVVDARTQATTVPGIWAAGDVTDMPYHQNNIAAGQAVVAVEDLYLWLKTR